jgi:hypothetical protein
MVGIGLAGWATSAPSANASRAAWSELARLLPGRLVKPDDPRYAALATPRNLRYAALMPRAVALCDDARDVATAIRWATRTQTPFAIRGGGHNYIDASSSQGLLISTRQMKRASVKGSRLHVQAGVLNADVTALLSQGGAGTHVLPTGTCPNVGVVGLTLGGGISPNSPWAGLAADRLRSATMVTAHGGIVTADAQHHADLFWALRGSAGGNLGIVTDLVYDLAEVPVARATTFRLTYPGAETAVAVASAWQSIRRLDHRVLGGSCSFRTTSDGQSSRVRAQVLLSETDARSLMAPLLSITGVQAEVTERTWWDTNAWYQTPVSPSNTFWDRSLYLDTDLSDDVLAQAFEHIGRFPLGQGSYGTLALFGWVGGRVRDVPAHATAYVHRNATSLLELTTGWPDPTGAREWPAPVPPAVHEWMVALWDLVYPHSTGESYQNFADPGLTDPATAYYGTNLDRLKRVKARWDPRGVFTHSQAVPLPSR